MASATVNGGSSPARPTTTVVVTAGTVAVPPAAVGPIVVHPPAPHSEQSRRPNFSFLETQVLLTEVKKYQDMLFSGHTSRDTKRRVWSTITKTVNELSKDGRGRTIREIKKKWLNLKNLSQRRAAKLKEKGEDPPKDDVTNALLGSSYSDPGSPIDLLHPEVIMDYEAEAEWTPPNCDDVDEPTPTKNPFPTNFGKPLENMSRVITRDMFAENSVCATSPSHVTLAAQKDDEPAVLPSRPELQIIPIPPPATSVPPPVGDKPPPPYYPPSSTDDGSDFGSVEVECKLEIPGEYENNDDENNNKTCQKSKLSIEEQRLHVEKERLQVEKEILAVLQSMLHIQREQLLLQKHNNFKK